MPLLWQMLKKAAFAAATHGHGAKSAGLMTAYAERKG